MNFKTHYFRENYRKNKNRNSLASSFSDNPAYLHHFVVRSLHLHTNCIVGSVTGAAEAAMLDLLALQFHGCRPVSDNADRFLETDTLQGSLSWYCVTDILGCPPRFLRQQTNKRHEVQRCCTERLHTVSWSRQCLLNVEIRRKPVRLSENRHTHTHLIQTLNLSVCTAAVQWVRALQQQESVLTGFQH